MHVKFLLYIFILFTFLFPVKLCSQVCIDDYFSINYQTSTVQVITQAAITRDDNISIAGFVLRPGSILRSALLAKTTKQGTVLWSRGYSSPLYDYTQFSGMVPLDDGGFMVSGMLASVDTTVSPPAILASTGFLARLDKYGDIKWTKLFDNIFFPEKMIGLKNGNIVAVLRGSKDVANTIVLCFDADGNSKWKSTISWRTGDSPGSTTMKELANGNIVLAQYVYSFDYTVPQNAPENGYAAIVINGASGLQVWNRAYWFNINQPNDRSVFGELVAVTELNNGNLSFIASIADTAYYQFRVTKVVTNIITDKNGNMLSVTGYTNNKPPLYASAAAYIPSKDQLAILMDNADAPQMLCLDGSGKIRWQKAYAKIGRSQETTYLLGTEEGFYFYSFTHNGGSKEFTLTKTDTEGKADCLETPLDIITSDMTTLFTQQSIDIQLKQSVAGWYSVSAIGIYDYKIQSKIICIQACCTDVTSNAPVIDLCNVDAYTLPNNDVVRSTGTYPIVYTTNKGCDSLVYYDITFSKSPDVKLGNDNCLNGKDSLVLKTNTAYNNYTWNGALTRSPYYVVTKPGTYSVSVTNACGTNADTVNIFQQCEFEITMPNAFTPNADRVNDLFRIPPKVTNRLVHFIVYNRWGQTVFETNDISKGWDGNINSMLAPAGTYVYYIIMESLDRKKKISKNGWVTLLR
jgi:gliding motility-associated-like protein